MSFLETAIETATESLLRLRALEGPMHEAAGIILGCLGGGKKLLVCGNGGSAADGADFSTEFTCRFVNDRRPFPALNLSGGGSLVTAIGNDYGFDEVFARQVRAFAQTGDVLVAITTSGNSKNILRALEEAKGRGLQTVALLGRDGGKAKGLATVELIVSSPITARIQEGHKFLLHVLCEMIEGDLPRG